MEGLSEEDRTLVLGVQTMDLDDHLRDRDEDSFTKKPDRSLRHLEVFSHPRIQPTQRWAQYGRVKQTLHQQQSSFVSTLSSLTPLSEMEENEDLSSTSFLSPSSSKLSSSFPEDGVDTTARGPSPIKRSKSPESPIKRSKSPESPMKVVHQRPATRKNSGAIEEEERVYSPTNLQAKHKKCGSKPILPSLDENEISGSMLLPSPSSSNSPLSPSSNSIFFASSLSSTSSNSTST